MEITTPRLLLREFKASDWSAVHAYQSDPRYLQYYPWNDRKPGEVKAFVHMFLDQQQQKPRTKFQLAAILKTNHQLIGTCGLRLDSPDSQQADIGYELAPPYWGKGYATEAANAMLDYGFRTLRLHRIWSWCIADNHRSSRVLEKIGMRLEGRLRENEYFKEHYWDTLVYAILASEWQSQTDGEA